jgi:APA family basic amino acid/polyamine antiporter
MSEEIPTGPGNPTFANAAPPNGPVPAAPARLEERLGVFSATMIVVGSMIGSGIFSAPSYMAERVQSPGILLGLWVFGGIFTLLGALAYGELAAMAPHAGGQYVFLREAYGRFWAFLYGWTLFLVIQTGFNAAVAIFFAKTLGGFFPTLGEANVVLSLGGLHINTAQLVGCGVIVLLTGVNMLGVREGAFVQNLFTVLKLTALVVLIVAGLGIAEDPEAHFTPLFEPAPGKKALEIGFLAGLAVALSKALFSYDAWNTVTFVSEEVRQPQRSLPRALLWGCVVTMIVYLLTTATYIANISMSEMQSIPENRVAQRLAEILFGKLGVRLVIVAILISTFGCVNGLILGGARVCFAMARDGLFFRSCRELHPRWHTPWVALVYQGVWSCVLTLSGTFDDLLTYTTFASVLFGALTVAGVYRLRRLQPDRPRPYRCWGYPVTPALYLVIAVPFLIYLIQGDPVSTGWGALLVLTGVPVYFWWWWRASGGPGVDR